jgi:hypothetical protein
VLLLLCGKKKGLVWGELSFLGHFPEFWIEYEGWIESWLCGDLSLQKM